jgi:hypothetical protein
VTLANALLAQAEQADDPKPLIAAARALLAQQASEPAAQRRRSS